MEVQSRGYRIHYEVRGDGPPLVLIPGAGGNIQRWESSGYHAALAGHFRVISLDPLGHGKSDRPHDSDAYGERYDVADVLAVLDAEGLETAHVWGYSLGGRIAGNLASLYPGRLRSLTSGGHAPKRIGPERSPEREAERRDRRIAALRNRDWDGYWSSFGFRPGPAAEADYAAANDPEALAARSEAGGRQLTEIDLRPLRGRILVYAGTDDLGLQAPGAIEEFRRSCDEIGARLELLDGLTHSEGFTRSDLVLPLVMTFLESQSQD
jgi:pimeloyl-ACP methyl ester carboxylesterase